MPDVKVSDIKQQSSADRKSLFTATSPESISCGDLKICGESWAAIYSQTCEIMWKDAVGRTRLKQSGYLITGEAYEQTIRMAADNALEKDRKAVEEYRRTWYVQIGDRGDYIKKHYEAPVIVQRLANILPDDAVITYYKSAQGDGQDGDKIDSRDEDEPMQ